MSGFHKSKMFLGTWLRLQGAFSLEQLDAEHFLCMDRICLSPIGVVRRACYLPRQHVKAHEKQLRKRFCFADTIRLRVR